MSSHGFHRFTQILRVRFVPTEFTEFTEFGSVGMAGMPYPPTSVRICAICGRLFSARSFCAFRAFCRNLFPPTDFTDLHRYLWCAVLPQNSQNTQNLAAWVWQGCHTLLICAHPCHLWEALLCQKFLCVPCVLWESLSSHGFLLRRVWHLAIPTPPAMGYSPTEYAEFTEPPTEMSSHGFHRFTQILRVRCSPTEFTEFTEFGSVGMAGMPYPPNLCSSVPSVGGSSLQEVLCIRCIPWELLHRLFGWCSRDSCTPWVGSVGMAGMPYPPTSVLICAICGSPFSARGSVYLVHSVGASSPLVLLVQQRQLHPLA